jgi:hypothetical protein
MNDPGYLVREELRARIDASEADRSDSTPAMLLSGLNQRIRWAMLRRRWIGQGLAPWRSKAQLPFRWRCCRPNRRSLTRFL